MASDMPQEDFTSDMDFLSFDPTMPLPYFSDAMQGVEYDTNLEWPLDPSWPAVSPVEETFCGTTEEAMMHNHNHYDDEAGYVSDTEVPGTLLGGLHTSVQDPEQQQISWEDLLREDSQQVLTQSSETYQTMNQTYSEPIALNLDAEPPTTLSLFMPQVPHYKDGPVQQQNSKTDNPVQLVIGPTSHGSILQPMNSESTTNLAQTLTKRRRDRTDELLGTSYIVFGPEKPSKKRKQRTNEEKEKKKAMIAARIRCVKCIIQKRRCSLKLPCDRCLHRMPTEPQCVPANLSEFNIFWSGVYDMSVWPLRVPKIEIVCAVMSGIFDGQLAAIAETDEEKEDILMVLKSLACIIDVTSGKGQSIFSGLSHIFGSDWNSAIAVFELVNTLLQAPHLLFALGLGNGEDVRLLRNLQDYASFNLFCYLEFVLRGDLAFTEKQRSAVSAHVSLALGVLQQAVRDFQWSSKIAEGASKDKADFLDRYLSFYWLAVQRKVGGHGFYEPLRRHEKKTSTNPTKGRLSDSADADTLDDFSKWLTRARWFEYGDMETLVTSKQSGIHAIAQKSIAKSLGLGDLSLLEQMVPPTWSTSDFLDGKPVYRTDDLLITWQALVPFVKLKLKHWHKQYNYVASTIRQRTRYLIDKVARSVARYHHETRGSRYAINQTAIHHLLACLCGNDPYHLIDSRHKESQILQLVPACNETGDNLDLIVSLARCCVPLAICRSNLISLEELGEVYNYLFHVSSFTAGISFIYGTRAGSEILELVTNLNTWRRGVWLPEFSDETLDIEVPVAAPITKRPKLTWNDDTMVDYRYLRTKKVVFERGV